MSYGRRCGINDIHEFSEESVSSSPAPSHPSMNWKPPQDGGRKGRLQRFQTEPLPNLVPGGGIGCVTLEKSALTSQISLDSRAASHWEGSLRVIPLDSQRFGFSSHQKRGAPSLNPVKLSRNANVKSSFVKKLNSSANVGNSAPRKRLRVSPSIAPALRFSPK